MSVRAVAVLLAFWLAACSGEASATKPAGGKLATATFAGGCFWCMEPPFENLPGVVSVTSGYTGGQKANPTYDEVSDGGTGHFEAVQIAYDPRKISYAQLLDIFWRNVDPADGRGQFCDSGPQYRSAIFTHDDAQRRAAEASKAGIEKRMRVYTIIAPASTFYRAEEYHQDYATKNPLRYKIYRYNCGRDKRLKEVWRDVAPQKNAVVLELFTSQGCSSCPPADKLLSKLGDEANVIPLAWHVDYWNSLGWRDPFSSAAASARQRQYARVLGSQVYTPQLVIDGTDQFVGSAEGAIRGAIERTSKRATAPPLVLDSVSRAANAVVVRMQPAPRDATIVLFENGVVTPVTHGENAGKRLTNDYIVRSVAQVGAGRDSISIPLQSGWRAENLGVAAFVQDPRTMAIEGAAVRAVR